MSKTVVLELLHLELPAGVFPLNNAMPLSPDYLTFDTALLCVFSNTPANCEYDWMNCYRYSFALVHD